MQNREIVFVTATRLTETGFYQKTELGQSLMRLRSAGIPFRIFLRHSNNDGLPKIYNTTITSEFKSTILVFVHDDVRLEDFFIVERLQEALMRYDIIGVAGNLRCAHRQCAWAFPEEIGVWDSPNNLVGRIGHHVKGQQIISTYGNAQSQYFPNHHQEVILLDGVFMAVDAARLIQQKVRFDEQFTFHHYDLDFCINAKKSGLKLGVWPIAITHSSGGDFKSKTWQQSKNQFLAKHWPQS